MLIVSFGDGISFKNAGFNIPIEKDTVLKKRLPRMLDNGVASKNGKSAAAVMKAMLDALAGAGPILSFLFGFALSNMVAMVEGM